MTHVVVEISEINDDLIKLNDNKMQHRARVMTCFFVLN